MITLGSVRFMVYSHFEGRLEPVLKVAEALGAERQREYLSPETHL